MSKEMLSAAIKKIEWSRWRERPSDNIRAEIEIRPMVESDFDRILRIERDAFTNPWSRYDFVLSTGPRFYSVVAQWNGYIVGYAVSLLSEDEMHIGNLAVAKKWRRRGIGGSLLMHLLNQARARGLRRVTLEVRMSNEAAQHLYSKHGFIHIAIRKGYYTHPKEDALIMMNTL